MTRKTTEPDVLQECGECGGESFTLVPVHRPDIPLHMEPIVNIDVNGMITGYSGRLMCVYCNAILPSELDQILTAGKWSLETAKAAHPSNPDWEPAEGNVIQFPGRSS